MIPGATEISQVFHLLEKLGVVEKGMDIGNSANYAIAYSPKKVYMEESSGVGEEFDDITEEELAVMGEEYQSWYIDKILLESDDE